MVNGCRRLTVKEVRDHKFSVTINFLEGGIVSEISKRILREHGISSIIEGQTLLVRGVNGNEDSDLRGVNPLSSIEVCIEAP
jgi:hypothetical protein